MAFRSSSLVRKKVTSLFIVFPQNFVIWYARRKPAPATPARAGIFPGQPVMHDGLLEDLCPRRAPANEPFIRYRNMEILPCWCLGLLRGTLTHLESVIFPWAKPACPPESFPHSDPSRAPRLVIFALSTANKFIFASGKCHFIASRGNDLSCLSPKDIDTQSPGPDARARGFRGGARGNIESEHLHGIWNEGARDATSWLNRAKWNARGIPLSFHIFHGFSCRSRWSLAVAFWIEVFGDGGLVPSALLLFERSNFSAARPRTANFLIR